MTEVFDQIKTIPGWFTIDDCAHFYLALSMQSAYGIRGDLFEIGSYHGRSTALMAYCLQPGETIVICDAFEGDTTDSYQDKPTPRQLTDNLLRVSPDLDLECVDIHACLSSEVSFAETVRFRFVHIDGGHDRETALGDLILSSRHLLPGGIIVMDDYQNEQWPGVTLAVDEFLAAHKEFVVLADLNRHGAIGRKIYLMKQL